MGTPTPSPGRRRPASLSDAEDAYEGVVVPISRSGRRGELLPTRDAERAASRRELDSTDRPSATERRARRRRQQESWLHRNALSLAALSVLIAILAVGFALVQMLIHSAPTDRPAGSASSSAGATPAVRVTAASTNPAPATAAEPSPAIAGAREVRSTVKALEPNYTVKAGDSLAAIATRFNTTVQRVQALNNLANPRVLSIGQKLVVPPPL